MRGDPDDDDYDDDDDGNRCRIGHRPTSASGEGRWETPFSLVLKTRAEIDGFPVGRVIDGQEDLGEIL